MATCRSSKQFCGGLRQLYGRFNVSANVCDQCWKRSLHSRQFSQVKMNDLHKFRDDQVTRSSKTHNNEPPPAPKGQPCFQAPGFCSNSSLINGTVDLVRPTKLCVLGTQTTNASVLVTSYNSLSRNSYKSNPQRFCSVRHFCSAEFKGQKGESGEVMEVKDDSGELEVMEVKGESGEVMEVKGDSGEVMEVKGDSGSADSGSQEKDVTGDDTIDKLTGLGNGHVYDDGSQQSELVSSSPPPVKMDVYNLAPLVPKSDVLRYLLHLNVDLAKIETKPKAANSLVKLDMEKDVMPVMFFLKDAGIPDSKLGKLIGGHPFIFEDFENAKLVVEYLKFKKFKKESIAHMIVGMPRILGLKVVVIDRRIGVYQKFFELTGNETRDVMTRVPRLILNYDDDLKEKVMMFRGFEFTKKQLKKIVLKCPSVFKSSKIDNTQHRLEYLLKNIPMDQDTIAEFSYILRYPTNPIKERHLFLLELGRAQYDPTKEKYISPTDLVCTPEPKFCQIVRTTPAIFKAFKMTL